MGIFLAHIIPQGHRECVSRRAQVENGMEQPVFQVAQHTRMVQCATLHVQHQHHIRIQVACVIQRARPCIQMVSSVYLGVLVYLQTEQRVFQVVPFFQSDKRVFRIVLQMHHTRTCQHVSQLVQHLLSMYLELHVNPSVQDL